MAVVIVGRPASQPASQWWVLWANESDYPLQEQELFKHAALKCSFSTNRLIGKHRENDEPRKSGKSVFDQRNKKERKKEIVGKVCKRMMMAIFGVPRRVRVYDSNGYTYNLRWRFNCSIWLIDHSYFYLIVPRDLKTTKDWNTLNEWNGEQLKFWGRGRKWKNPLQHLNLNSNFVTVEESDERSNKFLSLVKLRL